MSSHFQPPAAAAVAGADGSVTADAHAPMTSAAAASATAPSQPGMAAVVDAEHLAPSPAPSSSQTLETCRDIAYGSLSGMAGKVIEYPFDTIKVRLQSQPAGVPPIYKGPLDCFRQALRNGGGVSGLYRGISAPMVGAAMEVSSLFCSYRLAQEVVFKSFYRGGDSGVAGRGAETLPLPALCLCGSISGAITSLLLTPIELIKCKMQIPQVASTTTRVSQPGVFAVISSIFRRDGLSGFWRGQMGTLIRETGGSAAWFGGYEGVCAMFRKYATSKETLSTSTSETVPALPIYQQLIAGATAGVSYNFCFYPADTIKSRIQTQEVSRATTASKERGDDRRGKENNKSRRGMFVSVGKTLYKERGLAGFYQGCGITCLRSAPSSAFIFTIYEVLRYHLG